MQVTPEMKGTIRKALSNHSYLKDRKRCQCLEALPHPGGQKALREHQTDIIAMHLQAFHVEPKGSEVATSKDTVDYEWLIDCAVLLLDESTSSEYTLGVTDLVHMALTPEDGYIPRDLVELMLRKLSR